MGTWDTGPFDNDTAADFSYVLDDVSPEEREALIRGVLIRTVDGTGYLGEAQEAVAVAALIAARCPGGEPVDTPYGPEAAMPVFPDDLRVLADRALGRIADDEEGRVSPWVDAQDDKRWRAMLHRLRTVLVPPPDTIPLFDVEY